MHALEQPKTDQIGEHTRPTIGHEWKWHPGHRHEAHRHSNIFKGLEGEPGDHSDAYQSSEDI